MDKQALQQIIDTFQAAIEEAQTIRTTRRDHWTVCGATDFTPFRSNGNEIRLFGGPVYTVKSGKTANEVAVELHKKAVNAGSSMSVTAMPVIDWANLRTNALKAMIADMKARAEAMGVTL